MVDILLREQRRMMPGLDRKLLSRQTERVEPHRMKHIISFHTLFAGNDIRSRIAFRMPYVQTVSARIRKHIQHIILRFGEIGRICPERLLVLPDLLPFFLHLLMIVHCLSPLSTKKRPYIHKDVDDAVPPYFLHQIKCRHSRHFIAVRTDSFYLSAPRRVPCPLSWPFTHSATLCRTKSARTIPVQCVKKNITDFQRKIKIRSKRSHCPNKRSSSPLFFHP